MTVRVLQSFPHKIGAGRICGIAWQQAAGVARAGGEVTVFAGVVHRPLPSAVRVHTTLQRGRLRIPYRALGDLGAFTLHDRVVARALRRRPRGFDVVHTWPLAGCETLRAARELGIATVVERPNAHTRFAYEVVARECAELGVSLPTDQEHAFNNARLRREEEEYALGEHLLCPSEFVARTFLERGFPPERLLRHVYGFDEGVFHPAGSASVPFVEPDAGGSAEGGGAAKRPGLNALFVGVCAVRKGLHYALDAWLGSSACEHGTFRIAGEFLPDYERRLAGQLAHPSVEVLGHRDDVAQLMRESDVLLLPSIEEGFGLVCVEAIGSGCVPLVSAACTELCVHEHDALVHDVGDVQALRSHISSLDRDREQLGRLRHAGSVAAPTLTWESAGRRLLEAYEEAASSAPSAVSGRPLAARRS